MSLKTRVNRFIFVLYLLRNKQSKENFVRLYNTYHSIRLKQHRIVAVLCIVLSLIGIFELNAQNVYGWDKVFGGNGPDEAKGIVEMRDKGLVIVGVSNSFGNANQVYTIRTDIDGTVLWTDTIGGAGEEFGLDITVSSDQRGVVIVGNGEDIANGGKDVIFYKLDDKGNKVWINNYSTSTDDEAFGITTSTDGGYLITGYTENTDGIKELFILKIDSNGNQEWVNIYGGDNDQQGNAIMEMSNGDIVVTGYTRNISGDANIYVLKVNSTGDLIFEESVGSSLGEYDEGNDLVIAADGSIFVTGQLGNQSNVALLKLNSDGSFGFLFSYGASNLFEIGNDIVIADDGNLVIAGYKEVSGFDLNFYLIKVSSEGASAPIWEKSIGQPQLTELGFCLVKTYDGGFAIAGSRAESVLANSSFYLVKTNKNGATLTNHIIGKAFRDNNNDCNFQNGETSVRNWMVEAKGANRTFYGSVDADGNFDILTDTGNYQINIIIPNVYWDATTCQTINFPVDMATYDTVYLNYPIQAEIMCPAMEVDVSTARIIPCEDNVYRVDYCNKGTQLAIGATVDLIFEKNLTVNSSSLPWVSNDDSLYTFAIGNIDIGECGFFEVNVSADCNIVNEAHCVEARITPDDTCLAPSPDWDGSSLRVDSYCDGDSVIFLIQNVGADALSQEKTYIVIEDVILFQQPTPINNLQAGQVQRIAIKANGKHYRLIADQATNHPGRNYFTTASVEACDPDNQGASLGYVTQLEEDDRDPYQSKDCIENQLSFDPIDFIGYPRGYRDTCDTNADLITPQTDLKYHIRFQNVSTDTSHRVVIRDTIPSYLDITSIRLGASSHPYTFEAYGDGFVKFTFSDLGQVNSATNEMLSHGFIKYRISQKPNNPVGTIIENGATIFQDYNAPLETLRTRHQVGGEQLTDFLCFLTATHNLDFPNVNLKVYPNPFTNYAKIEVTGQAFKNMEFHVFDAAGQQVRTENFENNTLEFYRDQLPQGLYIFTINVKGQVVQSGKLIIQ